MRHTPTFRFALLIFAAALAYSAGIAVRQRYGVRVSIQNSSSELLRQVTIKLEHGKEYPLGDIASGKRRAIFIEPTAEDSIRLEFRDTKNFTQSEVVAGYVESGYCGDVRSQVLSGGHLRTEDDSFVMFGTVG
jgi:hypothetical protein